MIQKKRKKTWNYYWKKFDTKVDEIMDDFKHKIEALLFFILAGFCVWLLIQLLFIFYDFSLVNWIKDLPYIYPIFNAILIEIKSKSYLGIFYLFLFTSLFFLPVPLEALFFNVLRSGMPFHKIFVLAVGGILCGQIINYFLGRFFGFIFIHFIKKKTQTKIRKRLSKYGTFAILSVHIVPFPFPIFNFISGILRYNFFKWFTFVIIGLMLKHFALNWIYLKFI